MNLRLKICGMREPDNIREVGALLPDFLGFIFYDQSPRCVANHFMMPQDLNKSIRKVGVFVNEDFQKIIDTVNKYTLDFVQLHGEESVSLCEQLKNNNVGLIKTFSIDNNFDFELTESYQKTADFFLFDTKGKHYGGNATAFDWNLLLKYNQHVPFFLSGGISPENISEVKLNDMNLYGVDVNSGVETIAGIKNLERLKLLQSEMLKIEV